MRAIHRGDKEKKPDRVETLERRFCAIVDDRDRYNSQSESTEVEVGKETSARFPEGG